MPSTVQWSPILTPPPTMQPRSVQLAPISAPSHHDGALDHRARADA